MARTRAILVDITKCIGCHSCEHACKQLHGFPDETEAKLSPTALTVVEEHGDRLILALLAKVGQVAVRGLRKVVGQLRKEKSSLVATIVCESRRHGLLLSWKDVNGNPHQWAVPLRLIHADGNAIALELQDAGLNCTPTRAAHEALKLFTLRVVERMAVFGDLRHWLYFVHGRPASRSKAALSIWIIFETGGRVSGTSSCAYASATSPTWITHRFLS